MNRYLKGTLIAFGCLIAAGIIAPFIRVDQYREQIRQGLERGLHRRVQIMGDAHLNLFRGPGFSVEQVIIYDDPSVGIEPLADVAELQTTVSLSSLWTGRLEFATLRFVDAHLNLAKPASGSWNIIDLLAAAAPANSGRLPSIVVSNARVNFKFGDTKSVFYLTETDFSINPTSGGVDLSISTSAARTDGVGQGHGLFSGRGRIANGRIDLDAILEKSPIEDFVTLARGQSLGVHGLIQSRAKISGPLTHPEITGRFSVEDIHRWDVVPGRAGAWSMAYRGSFDAATTRFEFAADERDNPDAPVQVRLEMTQPFRNATWLIETTVRKLPAAGLLEFSKHMGTPLPAGFTTTGGEVAGTVRYASPGGMEGRLTIENAAVRLDQGAAFALPIAELEIKADEVHLLKTAFDTTDLELTYAPFRQHLEAHVTGRGVPAGRVIDGVPVPLIERFRGGTWSGSIHYISDNGEPGEWSADVQLRDTATTVPGLASPVKISAADVEIDGQKIAVHRMRATAGEIELYGEYKYEPDEARPHRFSLTIPSADAAELERLLGPSLQRSSAGFIARTLRWRSPVPDWLRERRATGELRIGTLTAGDVRLRGLRSRVLWTGPTVQFPDLEARIDEGTIAGRMTADLSKAAPQYAMSGAVKNLSWKNGHIDLEGSVDTAGTALQLLANLKAEGRFTARSVTFPPDVVKAASGAFDLAITRTGPHLRLSGVQAALGTERFNGDASTQPDGRLQAELASPTRMMRLSGTIAAPKLAIMELPPYGPGQRHPADAR